MIKTRANERRPWSGNREVEITRIYHYPESGMELECRVIGTNNLRIYRPAKDLTATDGFSELEKAIFKVMKGQDDEI